MSRNTIPSMDFMQEVDVLFQTKMKINLEQKKKEAEILQRVLSEIKHLGRKYDEKNNKYDSKSGVYSIDKEKYGLLLQDLQKSLEGTALSALFNRSAGLKTFGISGQNRQAQQGEVFEQEFTRFIDGLYKHFLPGTVYEQLKKQTGGTKKDIISSINIGKELTNVLLEDTKDAVTKGIIEVTDKIKEKEDDIVNREAGYAGTWRQGKIDVQGLGGYMEIDFEIIKTHVTGVELELLKALEIIHRSSFTLKNYLAYDWKNSNDKNNPKAYTTDISLGRTAMLKALSGSLNYLGKPTHSEQLFRMWNCHIIHNEQHGLVNEMIEKLTILYELTGAGLTYNNINLKLASNMADFIIVNNPDSPDIYVIPTLQLINEVLENSNNFKVSSENVRLQRSRLYK